MRAAVYALGAVIGIGAGGFGLWDDAYPPGVRSDAAVAAALVAAVAVGLGAAWWRPVPAWGIVVLIVLVPLAFFLEFGLTVSYWEEAAVRCQPPDPALPDCGLVTTASDGAFAGFAGMVGGLALGSLLRAYVAPARRRRSPRP